MNLWPFTLLTLLMGMLCISFFLLDSGKKAGLFFRETSSEEFDMKFNKLA